MVSKIEHPIAAWVHGFVMREGWVMALKGIPDGFEEVEVGIPKLGDWYLNAQVGPVQCKEEAKCAWLILRKVEKPKQYRPFRSAEEFRPQRCRWVRHIASDTCSSVIGYSDRSVKFGTNKGYWDYEMAFEAWVFDDGSPFGVEVA
jgi:hypothetical protein